jgi:DNA-binding NarL/FixJ family response regulator
MRLLIVADNALAAETIRRALRQVAGCQVLGFVSLRRESSGPIRAAAPDVVVIDDRTQDGQILDQIREVRASAPQSTLVMLTHRMDPAWLHEATAAGANAVVSHAVRPETLGVLIREIFAGTVFHNPAGAVSAPAPRQLDGLLTARELEILRLVASGTSNSGIAGRLWVTEQTVKFHLSNVYRKLGVANRTEASHYAYTHGLLAIDPSPVAA